METLERAAMQQGNGYNGCVTNGCVAMGSTPGVADLIRIGAQIVMEDKSRRTECVDGIELKWNKLIHRFYYFHCNEALTDRVKEIYHAFVKCDVIREFGYSVYPKVAFWNTEKASPLEQRTVITDRKLSTNVFYAKRPADP